MWQEVNFAEPKGLQIKGDLVTKIKRQFAMMEVLKYAGNCIRRKLDKHINMIPVKTECKSC